MVNDSTLHELNSDVGKKKIRERGRKGEGKIKTVVSRSRFPYSCRLTVTGNAYRTQCVALCTLRVRACEYACTPSCTHACTPKRSRMGRIALREQSTRLFPFILVFTCTQICKRRDEREREREREREKEMCKHQAR